jgi:SH3-like domain-containing protein
MERVSSRVVILEAYKARYRDPIAFRAGQTVDVQRADPDFPEWFWCRGPHGKEGWVHFSYLSQTTGQAAAVRDYSAQELTIAAGDEARLIRTLGGWAYLALDDGRFGWVPDNIIQARV